YEAWALRQAYLFAPAADFSRTVLESPSLALAVAEVPTHTWCDLGTPERVAWTLRALGAPPPAWLGLLGSPSCPPAQDPAPGRPRPGAVPSPSGRMIPRSGASEY